MINLWFDPIHFCVWRREKNTWDLENDLKASYRQGGVTPSPCFTRGASRQQAMASKLVEGTDHRSTVDTERGNRNARYIIYT